ncbi:MAG: GTP cyclohydrolase I FolE2 [Myxococcales bacterium FL481]|nr:MAG: GTP cyclohydrolase I FolE2 [Myxococcales bacterium FL481]
MKSHVDQQPSSVFDVQGSADQRQIPINKVGIKDIRHPVRVADRAGGEQHTVAELNLYVNLPHNFKGTHMSRFVEILNSRDEAISPNSFVEMLSEVSETLEAAESHIEMRFPYFVKKAAPVSGVESLMDYQVTFVGACKDNEPCLRTRVQVPVTSLCPCSKKISDYGAHNQRSHVTIDVETRGFMWIEEIIDIAEKNASSELYGVLKRTDEKLVTERAYDNPKFVEDLARDVALALEDEPRVVSYVVEVENFESIHNHSAYALIEGPTGGKHQRSP